MRNNIIHTIIVDDHLLFAEGLARILGDMQHLKLLKIVHSYSEVMQLLTQNKVDLILLDIKLKDENGIDICTLIKTLYPDTKVILISMFDPNSLATEIKKCNANGYIPKSTDAKEVKETINAVLDGEDVFLELSSNCAKETLVEKLITSREKEIIALIKQGKSAKDIAEILSISVFTVDTHRKNILKKLNLSSVKDLIAFSFSNEL
ncbi:MAG: response regulator transcription factor [Flavobacteriaceae bacterium]